MSKLRCRCAMVLAKALLERRDIIVLFARCMMAGLIFQNFAPHPQSYGLQQ